MIVQDSSISNESFEVWAHLAVADLHNLRPAIFWSELLAIAILGWSVFILAVFSHSGWIVVAAATVAAILLYRGMCFVHELTHIRPNALPRFETLWNILLGVPLLLPAYM